MRRKPIDVDGLKKVFRIRNGNLERLNYNYPNGKCTALTIYSVEALKRGNEWLGLLFF